MIQRSWLKKTAIALAILTGTLLAVLLLGLAVFWFWATSDGSLATVMRLASQRQPALEARGVTGALYSGGRIESLTWIDGTGLAVRVQGVEILWQPVAFFYKEVHLRHLHIESLTIDYQRPPDPQAALGPPQSLALPVEVRVDAFSVANLRYTARKKADAAADSTATATATTTPPITVTNLTGRYAFHAYSSRNHLLDVSNAQAFDGAYTASVKLHGDAPFALEAKLGATRQTAVPGSQAVLPLALTATVRGPIVELLLEAQAQLLPSVASTAPQANTTARINARIQPWASQPLAEAKAEFAALDLATLGLGLPRSALTGNASFAPEPVPGAVATSPPVPGSTAAPTSVLASHWNVVVDLQNSIPGPYDQQRLPVEQLAARLQWRGGSNVLVQELSAALAGGRLQATGESVPTAAASGKSRAAPTAPDWNVKATLERINPALLVSTLAAWPLDGRADVQSRAGVVAFDGQVQTAPGSRPQTASPTAAKPKSSGNRTLDSAAGSARSLEQLGLQEASAKGSWSPQSAQSAGGMLRLATVQVRTLDAQLRGEAIEIQPLALLQTGGKGQVQLTAPGLQAQIEGEARPSRGTGTVRLTSPDLALALRWLQKIPGLPPAIQSTLASGRMQLDARWQGGWNNNPAIDAKLAVPLLDLQLASARPIQPLASATLATPTAAPPNGADAADAAEAAEAGAAAAKAVATPATSASTNQPGNLKIRNLQASLAGNLQQATLSAQGQAALDQRRIALQLSLAGGQVATGAGAKSATDWRNLAAAQWQATLRQFDMQLEDPAVAQGVWQLATRAPVDLRWAPGSRSANAKAPASGTFDASAGQAVLTPPASISGAAIQPGTVAVATNATGAAVAARPAGQTAPSALIEWQPVRWQPGQLLRSAGRISGLPIGWIESFAGPQFAGSGLGGNLVFGGEWDASLTGDTLALKASLARSSGDISMQATSAEGTNTRIAAGVRQARIDIASNGNAINASVRWDSERAGTVNGEVSTRLERIAPKTAAPATKPGTTPNAVNPAEASASPSLAQPIQAGSWSWPASAPLTGQIQAQLPRIGVWSVFAPPGWRLRGSFAANIQVAGSRAVPQLSGTLQADDLALRSIADGFEFGNGRLRSRLDGTRLLIDEFVLQGASSKDASGKMLPGTGGLLSAKGQAGWISGAPDVQLTASINRLRASIRTDRQLTVSGDVQASLKGKATRVSGNLRVDQARILLPDEGTPQLGDDVVVRGVNTTAGSGADGGARIGSGKKGPEQASAATVNPAAAAPSTTATATASTAAQPGSLNLAVQLALGDDFRVQGKGIDTRISGTLAIASSSFAQPPRLVGTVTTEGGIFRAYGQRLNIERGFLRFTGPVDNPALDILAIRPVALTASDPQRVGVQVSGTALLPRVRLYAQPELPEAEKLSWLVLGRPAAGGGAEAALLQQAALALLGGKGGSTSGGLATSLGLDELSYKGSSSGNGGVSGGAITLGKRFSDNFYAAYERSISGAVGTLFVFYDLSKRFTIRAQAGSQSAVDLIFTVPFD